MSKSSSITYPVELILEIVQRNEQDHIGPSQLARDYNIGVNTIKFWLKEYRKNGYSAFQGNKKASHRISFDGKFKQRVISFWLDNPTLSSYDVAASFSIGRTTLRQWKKTYDENGMDALLKERRGAPMKPQRQKQIIESKKTDKERIDELERQLEYLQAENEYLKKLNALIHTKRSQQTKRKQL